jgi:hypothetical protein
MAASLASHFVSAVCVCVFVNFSVGNSNKFFIITPSMFLSKMTDINYYFLVIVFVAKPGIIFHQYFYSFSLLF